MSGELQAELGGLTDPEGNLGRPVPSGLVVVPGEIQLDGESIRWKYAGPARLQEISRTTLNEFIRLWRGDSQGILKFARKWGVLVVGHQKT